MLRKRDGILQIAFIILLLLSLLDEIVIFFAGWLVLGCWQVVSAALNTNAFMKSGFQAWIYRYWIFSAICIFLVVLSASFMMVPNILLASGMIASPALATVYLVMYRKLIKRLELRHELSGFTKSKY